MNRTRIFLMIGVAAFFLLLSPVPAEAVQCCCTFSPACGGGQGCIICENCTGCIASCRGDCTLGVECINCLITKKTGSLENVTVADAVSSLLGNMPVRLAILGDSSVRVSLDFKDRPVLAILQDIQAQAGVMIQLESQISSSGNANEGASSCGRL